MLQFSKTKRHRRIVELMGMYNKGSEPLSYIESELTLVVSWECLKCANCYLYGGKCGTKVTTVPCLIFESRM